MTQQAITLVAGPCGAGKTTWIGCKRFTLDDSDWKTPPKNQLVLIGRQLDRLWLQQMLTNCLTG
jgi:ABC-type branched-subunit amino acid transport system ATPase component